MKEIEVTTRGEVFIVLVDDEDFEKVNQYNLKVGFNSKRNRSFYVGSLYDKEKGEKGVKIHRLIMNAKEGEIIDHINHNTLDNRKSNLRFVTASQNCWNARKTTKKTTSKYKGVHWDKWKKRWVAKIQKNRKSTSLGGYKNEAKAAFAYNGKAIELFSEYAHLNKINISDF